MSRNIIRPAPGNKVLLVLDDATNHKLLGCLLYTSGNQSATADENVFRTHAGSPGSTDAATGQIPDTAGMDALPECVWQRSVQ